MHLHALKFSSPFVGNMCRFSLKPNPCTHFLEYALYMEEFSSDFFRAVIAVLKMFANTAKNTIILLNFLVWKFCGKAQFPLSFGQFIRNYAETVPFHEISTSGN